MKPVRDTCVGFLLLTLASVLLVDYLYKPWKEFRPTGLTVDQKVIITLEESKQRQLRQFVNNADGTLAAYGWGTNNETQYSLRH